MRNQVDVHPVLVVLSVVTVAAILLLTPMEPVQAVPPWRPTLTPTPAPTIQPTPNPTPQPVNEEGLIGAYIKLRAQFPQDWPWDKVHWQELWTIVEWQDEADWNNPGGDWHNVETWQGSLDTVEITTDGRVFGEKTWWVAERDFGDGLFRWPVYLDSQNSDEQPLVTSETFDLPHVAGEIVIVDVLLPVP